MDIDRARLVQERWFTLVRWLVAVALFAFHSESDLTRLLADPLAPIFVGFAAYTVSVTLLVGLRRRWPGALAYTTATLDTIIGAAGAGGWSAQLLSPGLFGVAASGIAVGVRRFPVFETLIYSFIIPLGIFLSYFALTSRPPLNPLELAVLGGAAVLPILVRVCTLATQAGGGHEPREPFLNRCMAAVRDLASSAGSEPAAVFEAAAAALASYSGSEFGGVVVQSADRSIDCYTVVGGKRTVERLAAQSEGQLASRLLALREPAVLDRRQDLSTRGLPDLYPQRLENVLGAPLLSTPECCATLFAANRSRGSYPEEDRLLAAVLGREAACLALAHNLAVATFEGRAAAAAALLAAAEAKRPRSRRQAAECSRFAVAIARELGWSEATLEAIRLAALLHDVGELAVPDALLDKPESLSADEFEVLKQHPVITARIIDSFNQSEVVLNAVLGHHEHWDGGGYPSGLAGENIPQEARILCLADAVEAMASARVYRSALSPTDAIQEVILGSGTQFDPTVVQAFLSVLRREGQSFLERPAEDPSPMVTGPGGY